MLPSHLSYLYDRIIYNTMGNRIAKHVWKDEDWERSTYYILDAQGNQISTYDHEIVSETTQFNLKKNNIYGSSRIGNLNRNINVLTSTISSNYASVLGGKYYEFSNHLGNVLTVFTDKKIPKDEDNNGKVDGYEIGIFSTADYSPFGVQLDGRTESGEYRYGYQGSEKDDELKGGGNSYTTFFRQLDPRVGRWFSVDPVFQPWQSPYCSMDGNPILFNDVLGNEIIEKFKDNDNKEAFCAILKTKEGFEYFSQFAKAGQKLEMNGETFFFEKNGKYHDQGIDLTLNDEFAGKNAHNGRVDNEGSKYYGYSGVYERMNINVFVNNSINKDPDAMNYAMNPTSKLARTNYILQKARTIIHEVTLHGESMIAAKNGLIDRVDGETDHREAYKFATRGNAFTRNKEGEIVVSPNEKINLRVRKYIVDGFNILRQVNKQLNSPKNEDELFKSYWSFGI
jgi:RHS repeat-associated protein